MADKIQVGQRVLFAESATGPLTEGVIKEYAPSEKYIGVQTNVGKQWFRASGFSVVETLPAPFAEPVTGSGSVETGNVE